MAVLTLTSARVGFGGPNVQIFPVGVGEAVVAGEPGHYSPDDQAYMRSKASVTGKAVVDGFFTSDAPADGIAGFAVLQPGQGPNGLLLQPLLLRYPSLLTANTNYFLATNGGLCLFSDLASTDVVYQLGISRDTTTLVAIPATTGLLKSGSSLEEPL